jgi:hypothetical protein
MSAKEKAEELLRIFYNQMGMPLDCEWNDDCYNKFKDRNGLAKTCALIAVDEILDVWKNQQPRRFEEWLGIFQYWQEVKQEIEKL